MDRHPGPSYIAQTRMQSIRTGLRARRSACDRIHLTEKHHGSGEDVERCISEDYFAQVLRVPWSCAANPRTTRAGSFRPTSSYEPARSGEFEGAMSAWYDERARASPLRQLWGPAWSAPRSHDGPSHEMVVLQKRAFPIQGEATSAAPLWTKAQADAAPPFWCLFASTN